MYLSADLFDKREEDEQNVRLSILSGSLSVIVSKAL